MHWATLFLAVLLLGIVCLSGCSRQPSYHVQGYVEGRYTYITLPVSGKIKMWGVQRGMQVKEGQWLFTLEAQPEKDNTEKAEAHFKATIAARKALAAELTYAKLMYERNKTLVQKKVIQQAELDKTTSDYVSTSDKVSEAEANTASSKAELSKQSWYLSQKKAYAPITSLVFDTYYRLGEYAEANKPILSLLAPGDIKAIFYVSAPLLPHLKMGKEVLIQDNKNSSQHYKGYISFISPQAEYTPPVIYSSETNAKLIYRVEAEFNTKEAVFFHPGQPIFVTLS